MRELQAQRLGMCIRMQDRNAVELAQSMMSEKNTSPQHMSGEARQLVQRQDSLYRLA